jgi:hypothetical protein
MIRSIRGNLSFANVMSVTAVMIALGGTSYAAIKLPANSVGSTQIKNKQVKNADLADSGVTSGKVKNGSLLSKDFALGQIPAGPKGDKGDPGTPGAAGAPGIQGPSGLLGHVIVRRTDVTLPLGPPASPGAITSGFATCAAGETIIGGSVNISNNADPATMEVLTSRPSVDTTGNSGNGTVPTDGGSFSFWKGTARALTNPIVGGAAMRVFAFCATP